MSKKRRDVHASGDTRIFGSKWIFDGDPSLEETRKALYFYRSRKARRAQSRLEGLKWRELSETHRLSL